MAQQYGVSITPVREAFRLLNAQGLVDIDTYVGASVRPPTITDLNEIYGIRIALCPLVARTTLEHMTDDVLEHARQVNTQMRDIQAPHEWVKLNREFHQTLDQTLPPGRLAQTVRTMADLSELYVLLSLPDRPSSRAGAYNEHIRLLNAYAKQDPDLIAERLQKHFTSTFEACKRALARSTTQPKPGN